MKVAIQGVAGSFHAQAARKLSGTARITLLACPHFQDVFDAVLTGAADCGVVAIENSIHGSINAVYRLLERHNLWIGGETTLAIEQYLIGRDSITLEALQHTAALRVLSQAPAFSQVELWLDANLPRAIREETQDTALSVKLVVQHTTDDTMVAIAGKEAARIYGGRVIAGPINDSPHNYTRFVMLYPSPLTNPDANRTTMIVKTAHAPGALLQVLQIFANHSINLSKLDSHPIADTTRRYAFYIDFDAGLAQRATQTALSQLAELGCQVKILGSYRV